MKSFTRLARCGGTAEKIMKHYRLYKLDDENRKILKGKDIHASDDAHAIKAAHEDEDCPICELWQGTELIGHVED